MKPDLSQLAALAWPVARAGEALQHLAARAGYPMTGTEVAIGTPRGGAPIGPWIEAVSASLGIEAEPVDSPASDLGRMLLGATPALVMLDAFGSVLAVTGSRRGALVVLDPTGRSRRVSTAVVCAAMSLPLEEAIAPEIRALLDGVALPANRRAAVERAFSKERLREARVSDCCWLVRLPPSAPFGAQLRVHGVARRALTLCAVHAAQLALGILGWALLGRGALEGHLERGWIAAWALLLAVIMPLRVLELALQGEVAIGFGTLLKRRLLLGAIRLDPRVSRREGTGQLLARTLETSAIEATALNGGIGSILALVELIVIVVMLGAGGGGLAPTVLLATCIVVVLAAGVRAYRRIGPWTDARRDLTHQLVERMNGHRTRLIQRAPAAWHTGEDEALERYGDFSRKMDRTELALQVLPYAWIVAGFAALVPGLLGWSLDGASVAVGMGGVVLAGSAMARLAGGLSQAVAAVAGWKQIARLFVAAAVAERPATPVVATAPAIPASAVPVLDAVELGYAYEGRPMPVLAGASLQVRHGDRVLLEGPSGGGKSTLASVLAGLRRPSSGLLLLDGLDRPTLGQEGWQRGVAAAPQYHDNHIFGDTLAFNLLLGRRWPPTSQDFAEALDVCLALGLGDLLARMPARMSQLVGETGWRLSHGERSRIFIARALLQRAPLVVLDESFAALDPETLTRCLRCVLERAPSLLVIAHP